MSLSKNSIYAKDIVTTPIKLKYDTVYTSSWDGYTLGITFPTTSISVNYARNDDPRRYDITGSQSILYRTIRHMYFDHYLSGSVLGMSGSWNWNQQSTAVSASTEYEYRYIPTSSAEPVVVICIPSTIFGEQISKNTFRLVPIIASPTEYDVFDDGNGNLLDRLNANVHVGTIIYSQGVIIITNPDYVPAFIVPTDPPPPYYTPTPPAVPYNQSYVETSPASQYVQFTP